MRQQLKNPPPLPRRPGGVSSRTSRCDRQERRRSRPGRSPSPNAGSWPDRPCRRTRRRRIDHRRVGCSGRCDRSLHRHNPDHTCTPGCGVSSHPRRHDDSPYELVSVRLDGREEWSGLDVHPPVEKMVRDSDTCLIGDNPGVLTRSPAGPPVVFRHRDRRRALPRRRGQPAESGWIRTSVCRASAAKSTSAWRISTPARTATAPMRQSMSLRTVSPRTRHERYIDAAAS